MSFGETESSMFPALQGRLSTSSQSQCSIDLGLIARNLASTTLPDAGPMVRIHFPPPVSHPKLARKTKSRLFGAETAGRGVSRHQRTMLAVIGIHAERAVCVRPAERRERTIQKPS